VNEKIREVEEAKGMGIIFTTLINVKRILTVKNKAWGEEEGK